MSGFVWGGEHIRTEWAPPVTLGPVLCPSWVLGALIIGFPPNTLVLSELTALAWGYGNKSPGQLGSILEAGATEVPPGAPLPPHSPNSMVPPLACSGHRVLKPIWEIKLESI